METVSSSKCIISRRDLTLSKRSVSALKRNTMPPLKRTRRRVWLPLLQVSPRRRSPIDPHPPAFPRPISGGPHGGPASPDRDSVRWGLLCGEPTGTTALKCAHSDVEKDLCVATSPRNDRLHFGSIGAMLVIFLAVFVLYLLVIIWGRWCARNRHSVSPAR